MFTISKESMATQSDCDYQAYLEWEKMLAAKNLRYYWKSYNRRQCDAEEYASESMRAAVTWVLDRRYGEKIRAYRSRQLFADEELAKLAAKREAAKVMQMAQQVTTWAQAHRAQSPAAQQELLPFFEPGAPSGSFPSQSATTNQAAEQVANWIPGAVQIVSLKEKVDQQRAAKEPADTILSNSAATLVDENPEADDQTEEDSASTLSEVAARSGEASGDWVVPKELVEEASAFAAASPVPQTDIEAALAKFMELATATSAVPLSAWTPQLLWTQRQEREQSPWGAAKRTSSPASQQTAVVTEEQTGPPIQPPDESGEL
jgi:hypothetical protein